MIPNNTKEQLNYFLRVRAFYRTPRTLQTFGYNFQERWVDVWSNQNQISDGSRLSRNPDRQEEKRLTDLENRFRREKRCQKQRTRHCAIWQL